MNKQEIITVLYELHKITGFRISLHGVDFEEIAAYPEEPLAFCRAVNENEGEHALCLECDRAACLAAIEKEKTHIYKCRYGLTEAVSPLYNFGTLTGFLMMGQIADTKNDARHAEAVLTALIGKEAMRPLVGSIPIVSRDMTTSYVKIMTICAQYLTLSNAMPSERVGTAEEAKRYIAENLGKKLVIVDICRHVGCSKSTLLTVFKKQYGLTVGEYITGERLERSVRLLLESKRSINEVALLSGYSDQSYFSKVFSERYGMPPSEYRTEKGRGG